MMTAALSLQLLFLVFLLSVISVIDLKTQTIPDLAIAMLTLGGICFQWFSASALTAISGAAFYFGCFWLIRKTHYLATGRIGLGFGDVKMAGAVGAWISIGMAPVFIGLASCTALFAIGFATLFGGTAIWRRRIPFGPFLALSLLVCWMLEVSHIELDGFYDVFAIA